MQGLFDPHIKSMLKKIREQLDFAQLKAAGSPQVVSTCSLVHRINSDVFFPDNVTAEIPDPRWRSWKFGLCARSFTRTLDVESSSQRPTD